jgi:hypothetical protein
LGEYERRAIKLPEFQRPYSWEKTQIATFWDDLSSFSMRYEHRPVESAYFLGPIVVIESKTEIVVLDGQQRLATATILLAALRDTARQLYAALPPEKKVQDLDYFARDTQRELVEKKDGRPGTYSLTLGELDEPFFLQNFKSDPPAVSKPMLRSHQLMKGAYEFFSEQVNRSIGGKQPDAQVETLKWLKEALTKGMSLVAIAVEDESDAYDIFEALNDRGLRLSVPDLVINLLLKRCSNANQRATVRQTWNSMIQQMGRRDVARFLRHLWLSRYGDLKAKGLYAEIKDHLDGKKIDSIQFAQACLEASEDYLTLVEIDKSLPKDSLRNVEGMVRYLGSLNSLPLLLSAYQCLNDDDFAKLVKSATALYVRHTLIGNQNPLELESAFYDAARELRAQAESKVSSAKALAAAKARLQKLNPTDSLVQQKFEELFLTKSEAAWFMAQLANAQQSKTKEIGMDKANVEHIFPQNAGNGWPNRTSLEPFIWHVGNLTILGKRINTKAQNKSFSDKCKNHYSVSEIKMTSDLLNEKSWSATKIRERAKRLAKTAIQVWK